MSLWPSRELSTRLWLEMHVTVEWVSLAGNYQHMIVPGNACHCVVGEPSKELPTRLYLGMHVTVRWVSLAGNYQHMIVPGNTCHCVVGEPSRELPTHDCTWEGMSL